MTARRKLLIRCDASARIGYGHLIRSMALAGQIQARGRWQPIFAMAEDAAGIACARAQGWTVEAGKHASTASTAGAEADWLAQLVAAHQPVAVILDVRSTLDRHAIEQLRAQRVFIACIDDLSERRLAADVALYPPIPQLRELDWRGCAGQCLSGWEWIIMPAQFAAHKPLSAPASRAQPQLLVSMGGSDPAGLSLLAIDALDELPEAFDTTLVIGSAFLHQDALNARLQHARREYEIVVNPPSMAALMAGADLALASFGATAYELACLGVPALHLSLSADHAASASALADAGAALSLGLYTTLAPAAIGAAVSRLLADPAARQRMGQTAGTLIDGRGAARLIELMEKAIGEPHVASH